MDPSIARAVILFARIYVAVGLLVSAVILFLLGHRIDPALPASTRGARLLILPGASLLWPWLCFRVMRGRPESRADSASAPPVSLESRGDPR